MFKDLRYTIAHKGHISVFLTSRPCRLIEDLTQYAIFHIFLLLSFIFLFLSSLHRKFDMCFVMKEKVKFNKNT